MILFSRLLSVILVRFRRIEMRSKTCCFSGHRKIPPMQSEQIAERLWTEIMDLISAGYVSFIAGGALGFDTMAELAVLKIKQSYP